MKREEVTERIKALMPAQDREALFPPSHHDDTPLRAAKDPLAKREKQDHVEVENWLNQHELWFAHQRMDKRTSDKVGNPDFAVGIEGLLVCIELKRPGNKLSPEQEEQRRKCVGPSKCQYHICYSGKEAIEILQKILSIT